MNLPCNVRRRGWPISCWSGPCRRCRVKRLVKSPKVYVRDSGLVHALLGLRDHDQLSGHPVIGASWEGFVVENLLAAAPSPVAASFYRASAGTERYALAANLEAIGVKELAATLAALA